MATCVPCTAGTTTNSDSATRFLRMSLKQPDRCTRPHEDIEAIFVIGGSMYTQEIIAAHPDVRGIIDKALIAAIDEMYACAQACTSCADGCLAEQRLTQLRQCIRLNLDCADVCVATATLASRRTGSNEEVVRKLLDA